MPNEADTPDVTTLDLYTVWGRLMPIDRAAAERSSWRPPSPGLEIDKQVQRLLEEEIRRQDPSSSRRSRSASLQSKMLERLGIANPFLYARLSVFDAVQVALHEVRLASERGSSEVLAKQIDRHVDRLAELLGELESKDPRVGRPLDLLEGPEHDVHRKEDRSRLRESIPLWREETRRLREVASYADHASGRTWHLAFARSLGRTWFELTGLEPAAKGTTSQFKDFVDAACRSIEPDAIENWDRSIQRAVESVREEWDPTKGFAYLRYFIPKNEVIDFADDFTEQFLTVLTSDDVAEALVKAAEEGGAEATRVALEKITADMKCFVGEMPRIAVETLQPLAPPANPTRKLSKSEPRAARLSADKGRKPPQ